MNLPGCDYLVPALAAHAVATVTMAFIPPNDTGTRFTAFVAIAALCFRAIGAADRSTDEGQSLAECMFGFILHANCFLVLVPLGAPKSGKTVWQRLRWASVIPFTPRRNIPKDSKGKKSTSNPLAFAALRALQAIVQGVVYHHLNRTPFLPFEIQRFDITSDKDSMLAQTLHRTLSTRDVLIRAEMAFKSLAMPALLLSSVHAAVSAFAVMLLGSGPADWPPLFGNIVHGWSIGRWYSHFWEKLMRKAFTINASFVTSRVLGLHPASPLGKTCIVMLSFAMSGTMHTISGWTPGPCESYMPMWTYLATGVVILAERDVQTLYACYVHGTTGLRWKWQLWEVYAWRLVGYCWVVLWWLEVLPAAILPTMRCHSLEYHSVKHAKTIG